MHTSAARAIPDAPCRAPNYFCTWGSQQGRDGLDEAFLLGPDGLAASSWAPIRSDLILLLDDGWDFPANVENDIAKVMELMGSFRIRPDRFPSCVGSPAEKLIHLNRMICALGWRGVGLWIAAQEHPGTPPMSASVLKAYYQERAGWCQQAGIRYWKVDWGGRDQDHDYRAMLTEVGREAGITVEHAHVMGYFNDIAIPWHAGRYHCSGSGRFANMNHGTMPQIMARMLSYSDVYRIYDTWTPLAVVSSMDRIDVLLRAAQGVEAASAYVNCEDEVTMGAALGLTVGIMRTPANRSRADLDHCYDEVLRAIRWMRLAAPVPANGLSYASSEARLEDDLHIDALSPQLQWHRGETIRQSAPAVMARGMELPIVAAVGDVPFVVATRFPCGATAVATLPRTRAGRSHETPKADVRVRIHDRSAPIGIFGSFGSLTLVFDASIEGCQIQVQDLLADEASPICGPWTIRAGELSIPGETLRSIGTSAGTAGDPSRPGLLLRLVST